MEKDLYILYGLIAGSVVIALIIWLFQITLPDLTISIILFLIVGVIIAFFAKDYLEKNPPRSYYARDEIIVACNHAKSYWKDKTKGEILEDIWFEVNYFNPYNYYGFIFKKMRGAEMDKMVWIIVAIKKNHPVIIKHNGEIYISEYSSKALDILGNELWHNFSKKFSGTPSEGILPEQSDVSISKRTPEKRVNVSYNRPEEKKQGIMESPPEDERETKT